MNDWTQAYTGHKTVVYQYIIVSASIIQYYSGASSHSVYYTWWKNMHEVLKHYNSFFSTLVWYPMISAKYLRANRPASAGKNNNNNNTQCKLNTGVFTCMIKLRSHEQSFFVTKLWQWHLHSKLYGKEKYDKRNFDKMFAAVFTRIEIFHQNLLEE